MSTLTPRLLLKSWDGADPFLRQDFNDNWNKLDALPGTYICTSSSRPSWGAAHAGMQAYETDTYRNMAWTGTSWVEKLYTPPAWTRSLSIYAYPARGTSTTYTVSSFTTTRPGNLLVFSNVRVGIQPLAAQNISAFGLIDGVDRTVGGTLANYVAFADSNAIGYNHLIIPVVSTIAVSAGAHTLGVKVVVGTGTTAGYIAGFVVSAFLTNQDAT